jgi:hypothetical protein
VLEEYSVAMQIQDLARAYQTKTDEELAQLATESEQLTPEANSVLTGELARRRIGAAEHFKGKGRSDQGDIERPESLGPLSRPESQTVGEFITEVLRVYHAHLWLFVQFTGPAVLVGYLALILGRNEVREIARNLPRNVAIFSHHIEFLEIWLADTAAYFVSWMASCLSFGAICSAVRQISAKSVPSVSDCFAEVRERIGPFVRLSLLLFVLLMVGAAAASLLATSIFWVLHQAHYRYGPVAIWTITFGAFGLILLVFSRFGLAVPALVLDRRNVSQAMFRSDELTEGKWVTLAILLSKSLVGGYVAGMLPFWIAGWAWPYIRVPWWLPSAASIAAVSVVEPFMFIGFALLYVKMSVSSSTSREVLSRRFAQTSPFHQRTL